MAYYKYAKFLSPDTDMQFDTLHGPGETVPISGIYRCCGCGKSVTSVAGEPFPPQNHHQHNLIEGRIRWRLIVSSHYP
jgi:hypothetical protein